MSPKIEYILSAVLLIASAAAVAFMVEVQKKSTAGASCQDIEVTIAEPWHFVTPEQIKGYVARDYGNCIGMKADSIDLDRIEGLVDSRSAVLKSQVWRTPDNMLHIRITQRKPLARFQKDDLGFYVDETGCFFPLQPNYTARVPIIDGDIPLDIQQGYKGVASSPQEQKWTSGVIDMILYLKDSKLWSTDISQISVISGDLVLIPRQGRERFIFGSPDDAADKFERMKKYYTHIAPSKEKDYYSCVSVKYKGQIICTQ